MTLLKEPLVHFLVFGALLFFLYSVINGENTVMRQDKINVSVEDIKHLQSLWQKQRKRMPQEQELKALIEGYIREEILYREALNLGLDQGDAVIRRRLAQKMTFISEDLMAWVEPNENALRTYFAENEANYLEAAKLSFRHIYFNPDIREDGTSAIAEQTLSTLRSRKSGVNDPMTQGDRFMLSSQFSQMTQEEIGALFGTQFASNLFAAERGRWQGPIWSGYGVHLVYVSSFVAARLPSFEAIRKRLQSDWLLTQRQELNEAMYRQFRSRYKIEIANTTQESKKLRVSANSQPGL